MKDTTITLLVIMFGTFLMAIAGFTSLYFENRAKKKKSKKKK
jgi:hypothetical protein